MSELLKKHFGNAGAPETHHFHCTINNTEFMEIARRARELRLTPNEYGARIVAFYLDYMKELEANEAKRK